MCLYVAGDKSAAPHCPQEHPEEQNVVSLNSLEQVWTVGEKISFLLINWSYLE